MLLQGDRRSERVARACEGRGPLELAVVLESVNVAAGLRDDREKQRGVRVADVLGLGAGEQPRGVMQPREKDRSGLGAGLVMAAPLGRRHSTTMPNWNARHLSRAGQIDAFERTFSP
jgi:hypothetical protein